MKKLRTMLAMLLCLTLLTGTMPAGLFAFAEETAENTEVREEPKTVPAPEPEKPQESEKTEPVEPSQPVETEPAAADEQVKTDAADIVEKDTEENAEAEAAPEATEDAVTDNAAADEANDAVVEESPEETSTEVGDTAASEEPVFTAGYVSVRTDGTAVYDNSGRNKTVAEIGAGVVYAVKLSAQNDMLQIVFVYMEDDTVQTMKGWVAASAVAVLDDAAVNAYSDKCARADRTGFAGDNRALPLIPVSCKLTAQQETAPDDEKPSNSDGEEALLVQPDEGTEPDAETDEEAEAPEPVPETITITAVSKLKLGVKDSVALVDNAVFVEPESAKETLVFSSSKSTIVSVNASGVVTAKKAGTATITVSASDGQKAYVKVVVYPAAKSFSINTSSAQIGELMTGRFNVATPAKTYTRTEISLSSDVLRIVDKDITSSVNVDTYVFEAGSVTEPTPVTVSALRNGTVVARKVITVYPAPDEISLTGNTDSIVVGMGDTTKKLLPVAQDDTVCGYEYSVEPEGIVTVSADGKLTPVSVGQATVTVTASNNPVAKTTGTVTVLDRPSFLTARTTTAHIAVGEKTGIADVCGISVGDPETQAASLRFKSSKTRIVTVDGNGMITAKKAGTSVITVTAVNNSSAVVKITVKVGKKAGSMSLSLNTKELGSDMDAVLTVNFPKNTYRQYRLETDRPDLLDIAEPVYTSLVNRDTVALKAKEIGEVTQVTVRAISLDGALTREAVLTLYPAPESITASDVRVGLGINSASICGVYPENTRCRFVYESLNPEIAKVNASTGAITTVAVGEAVIRVTASNKPQAAVDCVVTVLNRPSVILPSEGITVLMGVGDYVDLKETYDLRPAEGEGTVFSYKSSKTKFATVSASGRVYAKKIGTSVITVTAINNTAVRKTITVKVMKKGTVNTASLTRNALGTGMTAVLTAGYPKGIYGVIDFEYDHELLEMTDPEYNSASNTVASVFTALQVNEKTETEIVLKARNNGWSRRFAVTVYPGPDSITISPESLTVGMGQTGFTVAGIYDRESALCELRYSSSDESVIAVDAVTGSLTTVGVGTAQVTVTASNTGVSDVSDIDVRPAPTAVLYDGAEQEISLGVGDTYAFGAKLAFTPANAASKIEYSSSNPAAVTVDAKGTITAVGTGSAEITMRTHNGLSAFSMEDGQSAAELTVYVENAPSEENMPVAEVIYSRVPGDATDYIGCGMRGILRIVFKNGTYGRYSLSSDKDLITVDMKAKRTERSENSIIDTIPFTAGSVSAVTYETIMAVSERTDAWEANATVKILPGPSEITVDDIEMKQGETERIVSVAKNSTNTKCTYTFESSDASVASVDNATHVITPNHSGEAVITVKASNTDAQTTFKVCVEAVPENIGYEDLSSILLAVNDRVAIFAPGVFDMAGDVWEGELTYSLSGSCAQINESNEIAASAAGTATLTATTPNGLTASYDIEVVNTDIDSVYMEESPILLYVDDADYTESAEAGGFVQFIIDGERKVGYGHLDYSVQDETIATVDANGVVTAVACGSTVVTATSMNGKTAEREVCVLHLPEALVLAENSGEVNECETFTIVPVFEDGYGATVLYESQNVDIASVDESGVVTGVGGGTTVIRVSAQKGLETEYAVTVIPGPDAVRLPMQELVLVLDPGRENPVELPYTFVSSNEVFCSKVTVTGDDGMVVTVDEQTNCIYAEALGETDVCVTACNGKYAKCHIRVVETSEEAVPGFEWDTASILTNDSREVGLRLAENELDKTINVISSDPSVVSVECIDGVWSVTSFDAKGNAELSIVAENEESLASATVSVIGEEDLIFAYSSNIRSGDFGTAARLTMKPGTEKEITWELVQPMNLISTFEVVSDSELIGFEPNTAATEASDAVSKGWNGKATVKTGSEKGTAVIRIRDYEFIKVIVRNPQYRALLISEFNGQGGTRALPFAANNIAAMRTALKNSVINGERYSITEKKNPNRNEVLSLLSSTFAAAEDIDVSVVYIVAHGHNNGRYDFGVSSESKVVYSNEIYDRLNAIRGNVVLLLDSCKSGAFITDCASKLKTDNHISVATAQVGSLNASFFKGSSAATQIEFFTCAFTEGVGVVEGTNAITSMKAVGRSTGTVTVKQAFDYAVTRTPALISAKYKSYKSSFIVAGYAAGVWPSGWSQKPQTFIASGMNDLVLFAR